VTVNYIFLVFSAYVIIKTISYGIYCIKTTGIISAVSAFTLALGIAATGVGVYLDIAGF
jgi:hypothetical protein